jgi:hypothetical protein
LRNQALAGSADVSSTRFLIKADEDVGAPIKKGIAHDALISTS